VRVKNQLLFGRTLVTAVFFLEGIRRTSGGLSEYASFVNAPPPDFPWPNRPCRDVLVDPERREASRVRRPREGLRPHGPALTLSASDIQTLEVTMSMNRPSVRSPRSAETLSGRISFSMERARKPAARSSSRCAAAKR
jgi:hypothetical protein